MQVAILGGGRLGKGIATVVGATKADVRLWARRPEVREQLAAELPTVSMVESVARAAEGAQMIMLCVPASGLREVVSQLGEIASGDQLVIHAVRGFCPDEGLLLPHRVIRQETCLRKIGVLGGPLFAPALASDQPMGAVLGCRFDEAFSLASALTAGTQVRIHPTHDLVGVETAGAVSNIAALAVGMADALELGEMARGVLLTRGLGEAARLGVALGAEAGTFAGLAGVGDLIPRAVASTERHHAVGRALVAGKSLSEALAESAGEVEGVLSANRAAAEAEQRGLGCLLIQAVDDVCQGRKAAAEAIPAVLQHHLDLGRGLGLDGFN